MLIPENGITTTLDVDPLTPELVPMRVPLLVLSVAVKADGFGVPERAINWTLS